MIHATGPEKQLAIEFRDPQKESDARTPHQRIFGQNGSAGCPWMSLSHALAESSRPASLAAARLIAPSL